MGFEELTYFDFAEDDYNGFKANYEHGFKFNFLASMAQNACEKYLKHIIDEYANPGTAEQVLAKNTVLRTHNLQQLLTYIRRNMGIDVSPDIYDNISKADGYYFSVRYPGDSSRFVDDFDLDRCNEALEATRDFVLDFVKQMNEQEQAEEKTISNQPNKTEEHDISDDDIR